MNTQEEACLKNFSHLLKEGSSLIKEQDQRIALLEVQLTSARETIILGEQRIKELETAVYKLDEVWPAHLKEKTERIAALESLLSDAMKTLSFYVNVPEAQDLRDRYDKLKSQP